MDKDKLIKLIRVLDDLGYQLVALSKDDGALAQTETALSIRIIEKKN